jgi:hypothetical protein
MGYWMDGVFLRVLRDYPALAPTLFKGLFHRAPSDAPACFFFGGHRLHGRCIEGDDAVPVRAVHQSRFYRQQIKP